jgi:alginate O-acetyltransferase complex protein AlgI
MFSIDYLLKQFLYDEKNPLLFSNGFFVYFFVTFICCYYLLRNKTNGRSIVVSLFSLYFFYKASGSFVILVIASSIIDFVLSNIIYKQKNTFNKKITLGISILANLGLLIYFKYTNLFLSILNEYMDGHFHLLNIILPVGISFYTFENISYIIDVYKGEFVPEKKYVNYLLFLSFFPKLVMGPIVRAKDFIPQLYKPYNVSNDDFTKGYYLILTGLFKKLIISDFLTLNYVNYIFDDPSRYSGVENIMGVFCYAIVIYCDFSGYSDIAIGIAKWLGINIPQNFNSPYQSKNISEFWKRWHISLSQWLKDYLYIAALGGNRGSNLRTNINLLATMILGGLWHGGSVNFIIWGAIHGVGLIIHKTYISIVAKYNLISNKRIYTYLSIILTFVFVNVAWIFFRAENLHTAQIMIHQILFNFSLELIPSFIANYKSVLFMMLFAYILHFIPDQLIDKYVMKYLQKANLTLLIFIFIIFLICYSQFKSSTPVMPIYLQF